MVPKIHAKGTSFAAVTRYVLHDKQADTSYRVEWTETINLGTDNPEAAARVMAYTAMDAERLKREAGIPNTGRKSKQHVFHATLSWHADESQDLTRDHKLSAAKWFLQKIGAADRQAIVVSHQDEPQPHVHIIVNRISPTDGRILSSSLEKIKASEWAEKYERDRGKIYCDQRVINNAARKRGEYVRGDKDEARHFQDMRQQAGKNKRLLDLLEAEVRKMKRTYHEQKETERKAQKQREFLDKSYQEKLRKMREELKKEVARTKQNVQAQFRPEWEQEYFEQQAQLAEFALREKDFLGRAKNTLSAVDFRRVMGQERPQDGRAGSLAEAFKALGDSGARLEILKKQQALREQEIKRRQNFAELKAVQTTRRQEVSKMRDEYLRFKGERDLVNQFATARRQALEERIREISRDRHQRWKKAIAEEQARALLLRQHQEAAQKAAAQKAAREQAATKDGSEDQSAGKALPGRSGPQNTRPGDLLPRRGAEERARQIDQLKEREARYAELLRQKKDRQKEQGKGGAER